MVAGRGVHTSYRVASERGHTIPNYDRLAQGML